MRVIGTLFVGALCAVHVSGAVLSGAQASTITQQADPGSNAELLKLKTARPANDRQPGFYWGLEKSYPKRVRIHHRKEYKYTLMLLDKILPEASRLIRAANKAEKTAKHSSSFHRVCRLRELAIDKMGQMIDDIDGGRKRMRDPKMKRDLLTKMREKQMALVEAHVTEGPDSYKWADSQIAARLYHLPSNPRSCPEPVNLHAVHGYTLEDFPEISRKLKAADKGDETASNIKGGGASRVHYFASRLREIAIDKMGAIIDGIDNTKRARYEGKPLNTGYDGALQATKDNLKRAFLNKLRDEQIDLVNKRSPTYKWKNE